MTDLAKRLEELRAETRMVEPMAKIIESSENMNLETMLTVVSDRGDEFIINSDALAMAFANLISERDHEHRMGWTLENAWFKDAVLSLETKALKEHRAMLSAAQASTQDKES